jgi:topoisomerase IA-like protein
MAMLSHSPANSTRAESIAHPAGIWYTKIEMSQLKREILRYSQEIIPGPEVDSIYNSLSKINLTGTENEKRHVQSVKQNAEKKQRALQSGICPRCGNNLVLRKGKYGDFYGCSNYPTCKFTQNIRK